MKEAMAAALLTRQAMAMPHTLPVVPEEPPACATHSRRVSASVVLAAVSLTETTAPMEVEAMVADTRPVDVIMAERYLALAMLSKGVNVREVMDAATVTEAKVLIIAHTIIFEFVHLEVL